MADLASALSTLAQPFFDQGVDKVFVTLHCNRLFVGRFPAKRCRVCGGVPAHLEMLPEDEPSGIVRELQGAG